MDIKCKDPDSKKTDPDNTDPNNKNDVNNSKIPNNDKDDSHNDKKRRPKKNNNKNRIRKKSNNQRKRNNRRQNNTRRNGRYRWYRLVTVDYLLGNLPEYRNHEDEQKIVLIWDDGDKGQILLDEHIDELPMKNLNTNQLIRKKRDYTNTLQLQDKLQTKNIKQHDSKENEKDKLNTKASANDHTRYVDAQNNKLENIQNKQNVKKKKTYKNLEKSREHYSFEEKSSSIDNLEEDENSMNSKNYGNNNSEMERSHLKTIGKMPENKNDTPTISNDVQELTIERKADTPIHELSEIDTLIDENSNSAENQDDQNYESYSSSSSLETEQEIPNFKGIEDNKEHDILYNIRHPMKSKLKKIGKKQSNDNEKLQNRHEKKIVKPLKVSNIEEKVSHQKTIKPNSPNSKDILILSYDEPELTTEVNDDIATQLPTVDEIDASMDKMNSNSDENLDDQNNESSSSSLKTKQGIPNYSDIEDNKERDILNNIKHPFEPTTKKLRKKISEDNAKLPKIYKQKSSTPLETTNSEEKVPKQTPIKALKQTSNNVPSKSIDVPKLTKGDTTEIGTEIPAVDEIDTLMDKMNSNAGESSDDQNYESSSSLLNTKQDIPNYSDNADDKERDILNNIKHPFEPTTKKLRKKISEDNAKLPKIYKQKSSTPLETTNSEEKVPKQTPIKALKQTSNNVPSKSIDVPKLTKGDTTEIGTEIPAEKEIDTLMDKMNTNADESSDDQNNESSSSSLNTKQEIPNYSDIADNEERDILNDIKHPFEPTSKKLRKNLSEDNEDQLALVPATVTIPKSKTEIKIDTPLDDEVNKGHNSNVQKMSLPKTVLPGPVGDINSGRDIDLRILSIPKDKDEEPKSVNGKQEVVDPDHKSVTNPVDQLLDGQTDVGGSQSSPIDSDDINDIIK
ncbi:general transcriptional corepressor trfA, partial [Myzus persicae]|uniref:general transcriptional corepressor trfA n=1 Tax=Myzus persicae TaxID=13164 RepID=UPI000B93022A